MRNRWQPREALFGGMPECGLAVDVEFVGETHEVLETVLDDSEFGRTISKDGLYVVKDEVAVQYQKVTAVVSKLVCDLCDVCPAKDYSVTLTQGRYIAEGSIQELKVQYARAVIVAADARTMATDCVAAARVER